MKYRTVLHPTPEQVDILLAMLRESFAIYNAPGNDLKEMYSNSVAMRENIPLASLQSLRRRSFLDKGFLGIEFRYGNGFVLGASLDTVKIYRGVVIPCDKVSDYALRAPKCGRILKGEDGNWYAYILTKGFGKPMNYKERQLAREVGGYVPNKYGSQLS